MKNKLPEEVPRTEALDVVSAAWRTMTSGSDGLRLPLDYYRPQEHTTFRIDRVSGEMVEVTAHAVIIIVPYFLRYQIVTEGYSEYEPYEPFLVREEKEWTGHAALCISQCSQCEAETGGYGIKVCSRCIVLDVDPEASFVPGEVPEE